MAREATAVLLVRHGQSTWNADGRWQGHADAPLSALGEAQALAAAAELARADGSDAVSIVVTSDLQRARATGALIAAALRLEPPEVEPRLREVDAGPWTGLTRVEIEAGWPGYLAEGRRPEGFESADGVRVRAVAALTDLSSTWPGRSVLAVTHAGVIRTLERALAGDEGPVPNLGGRALEVDGQGPTMGGRVLLIDPAAVTVTVPTQL